MGKDCRLCHCICTCGSVWADCANVAKTGLGDLYLLGRFVLLLFYVGYLAALLVVFPIIAYIFKVPYLKLLSNIKDLKLIAFTTGGSAVVLPINS